MVFFSLGSRSVTLGEPSASYTGTVEIELRRGIGVYGIVEVTWQILPRHTGAFVEVQGVAQFADMSDYTTILLQVPHNI